jgi:hypothetical protein
VARQERAVDPLDGPLQAFAYDLRKVRADAGLPTYRALAKVAGFSATTLSEAAGGMRKPTLDVVLAYVGACHGDTDYWRCRWEALDDPAPQAGDPPVEETTAQRAPDPDEPPTLDDPVQPAPARRRRRWRIVVPVAATLSVAVAAGAFAMHRPARNGCPARPKHPAFTALSYGAGARVHSGAVRDAGAVPLPRRPPRAQRDPPDRQRRPAQRHRSWAGHRRVRGALRPERGASLAPDRLHRADRRPSGLHRPLEAGGGREPDHRHRRLPGRRRTHRGSQRRLAPDNAGAGGSRGRRLLLSAVGPVAASRSWGRDPLLMAVGRGHGAAAIAPTF